MFHNFWCFNQFLFSFIFVGSFLFLFDFLILEILVEFQIDKLMKLMQNWYL